MAIPYYIYKNTLDHFIDSLNIEFLKALRFESVLIDTRIDLEGDYFDKNRKGEKNKKSC